MILKVLRMSMRQRRDTLLNQPRKILLQMTWKMRRLLLLTAAGQDAVSVKVEGIKYVVQEEAVLSVAGFIAQVEEIKRCINEEDVCLPLM